MPTFKALDGLDRDIQQAILCQIRDLWTHGSTALEGNSLTLGETKFVIEQGLTVSGKPLKDHQEVVGHARAIDLIYRALDVDRVVDPPFLFDLHRAVQTEVVLDTFKPVGAWKVEPNGTYAVTSTGEQTFIEYAQPADVPVLMAEWLDRLAELTATAKDPEAAIDAYAQLHLGFVHIHPFWDGNGRMARLLSNIPLLRAGQLPLCIERERRQAYIELLASYQIDSGQPNRSGGVWPKRSPLEPFREFCRACYRPTLALLERAREQQQRRGCPRR